MKSQSNKRYNIIAFLILPLIIIIITIGISILIHTLLWKPTVDYSKLSKQHESGYLYEEMIIKDNEEMYSVYSLRDSDLEDAEYYVAFVYESLEDIDGIEASMYGGEYLSYWDGEYDIVDFTSFDEFDYEHIEDVADIEKYRQVRVYDISDYKGYEIHYNNGIALGEGFIQIGIISFGVASLIFELAVAIVIKLLVPKNRKK